MLEYPNIDPVAFHLGPLPVHWYGLMYLFAFLVVWTLLSFRIRYSPHNTITHAQLSDMLFYSALGVIIGGRLGYVFFYDFSYTIAHPLFIFQPWKGGMSFHGGLLGVTIAIWIYSSSIKKTFLELTDFIIPAAPLGLAFGRLGNFINGELWGRTTDLPWGIIFPNAGDVPRHPSQLYEFLLEGIVLFIVLWVFSNRPRPQGAVSGLFLLLYGLFRFIIEFFREPDQQVGYLFTWFTEGQLLCLPMMIAGIILFVYAYKKAVKCNNI